MKYLEIKIHHLILDTTSYKRIVVTGEYDRNSIIANNEKGGKITNWQRPTAEINSSDLIIKCFPGRDYVRHYASLIKTYLHAKHINKDVFFILPEEAECIKTLKELKLHEIPLDKTVILGSGLPDIFPGDSWQKTSAMIWSKNSELQSAALIFEFSFWGDIFGHICRILSESGVKNIIYTAKAGSINENLVPNKSIVTGHSSFINGQYIEWDPFLKRFETDDDINLVDHCCSASMVYESKQWVKKMNHFDIVESEIGYGAKACLEHDVQFSYIHFISNSLTVKYDEDLSNERSEQIVKKREKIKKIIRNKIINNLS